MTEQIARALGCAEYEDKFAYRWHDPGDNPCEFSEIEDWISSLEGEKAVRDKVRELCKERNWDVIYRYEPIEERFCEDAGHYIKIVRTDDAEKFKHEAATESEAWTAALLFLWEQGNEGK